MASACGGGCAEVDISATCRGEAGPALPSGFPTTSASAGSFLEIRRGISATTTRIKRKEGRTIYFSIFFGNHHGTPLGPLTLKALIHHIAPWRQIFSSFF
jgi:hypothetical protein